jgi:hypothetical protein
MQTVIVLLMTQEVTQRREELNARVALGVKIILLGILQEIYRSIEKIVRVGLQKHKGPGFK